MQIAHFKLHIERPEALGAGKPRVNLKFAVCNYRCSHRRFASGQNSSHRLPPRRLRKPLPERNVVCCQVVALGGSQVFSMMLLKMFAA